MELDIKYFEIRAEAGRQGAREASQHYLRDRFFRVEKCPTDVLNAIPTKRTREGAQ